jgi:hypothetical protein
MRECVKPSRKGRHRIIKRRRVCGLGFAEGTSPSDGRPSKVTLDPRDRNVRLEESFRPSTISETKEASTPSVRVEKQT